MSSRTRRNQGLDWQSTDLTCPVPTNDESAFSWGNGFMASSLQSTGPGGPDDTGSLSESIWDMSRQLSTSGQGTNNYWQRGASQQGGFDSFYSGGLGLGWGGGYQGEHGGYSGGLGGGLGGGGGHWNSQSYDANGGLVRDAQGYGGGAGGVARADQGFDLFGQSLNTGAEAYRGAGGNAYQFRDEQLGRTGYGLDGNWTPVGINNASADWNTSLGSGHAGMENAVFNRRNASLEGYRTDAGGYGVQGGYSNRTEFNGIDGHSSTALGETDVSIGSISRGRRHHGGLEVGPDGSVMGNYGYKGGNSSFGFKDVNASHDFGGGNTIDGHMGSYGGVTGLEVNGGWNNTTHNVEGHGSWSQGRRVEDVRLNATGPGGYEAHAGMGSYENGQAVNIDRASVGADGVHVAGGGHWGGHQLNDLSMASGWRDTYYTEASLRELSNRSYVSGAHVDIDGSGLNAGFETARTGGWRANNLAVHNELLGVNTDLRVGGMSNDTLLEGGSLTTDANGLHAGLRNYDGGGVRVTDASLHSDLGGYGTADAHLGSFTNTNSIQGANLDIGPDGVHAGVDQFSVAGMTIDNAGYDVRGPGGMYSQASLGHLQTGLNGRGAYADITEDGFAAGVDQFTYDRLALNDLHARGGVDGVYESQLDIGAGRYMSGGAENVRMNADENGFGLSADNARFNYLALENAHAGLNFGDGAGGASADIGRGSYLGGSAGHIEFQRDLLNSSLSIDDLNAHGLQLEDTHLNANIGDATAHLGADELNLLDLNAGHLESHTQNGGLQGQMAAEDVNLDLIHADNLGADIGWNGQTLLGARTDIDASAGVERANGRYDLQSGTASGEFENANLTAMTDDTRLEAFGYGLDVGRTGADIRASGSGDVDLSRGAANGDVNFAGTELALFGQSVELGDWAQAQAGVDVSQGAANVQLGGQNGVGADVNLSEGNIDLNAFGYTLDVDETAANVWNGATSMASDAGSAVASFFSGW